MMLSIEPIWTPRPICSGLVPPFVLVWPAPPAISSDSELTNVIRCAL